VFVVQVGAMPIPPGKAHASHLAQRGGGGRYESDAPIKSATQSEAAGEVNTG